MLPPTIGRFLSAVGAVITVLALLLVWYHVDRAAPALDEDSTGWQTFTRLRWVILGGAALTLISAAVRQTRPILVARTVMGLLVAALIFRRIVSPPDLSAELDPQLGLWVGVFGALLIALGGLVDTGRRVVEAYPDLGLRRGPAPELGPGEGGQPTPVRPSDDPNSPSPVSGATFDVTPPHR